MTRSLAQELPDGLATVAFNPGVIDTDMLRSTFGESAGSYEKPDVWAKHAVTKLEASQSKTMVRQSSDKFFSFSIHLSLSPY